MTRMSLKETRRLILDMYHLYPPSVLADMSGRTVGSIRTLASAMGAKSVGRGKDHAPEFSAAEIAAIRSQYGKTPVVHLARELGRTPGAVQMKSSRLGLGRRRTRPWSIEDDQVLREQYPDNGARYVARALGRSINAVKHRARQLVVRRNAFVHPWTQDELSSVERTGA